MYSAFQLFPSLLSAERRVNNEFGRKRIPHYNDLLQKYHYIKQTTKLLYWRYFTHRMNVQLNSLSCSPTGPIKISFAGFLSSACCDNIVLLRCMLCTNWLIVRASCWLHGITPLWNTKEARWHSEMKVRNKAYDEEKRKEGRQKMCYGTK
jgi:hypothetical protein